MTGAYSRCTAVLSFYDEPLELLAASVASLAGVVDHLVAVDGAYLHFPEGKPSSDPQQMRLIAEICSGARIGLTTHTPTQVWAGNEVSKRTHALHLAEAVTDPEGWYFINDADCVVTSTHPDWFRKLEKIAQDGWGVIEVGVRETRPIPGVEVDLNDNWSPVRLMYRAVRGMAYGPAHWTVHAPDPETGQEIFFWGPREFDPISAYAGKDLLHVDHRFERPEYRKVNARQYYADRDRLGLESGSRVMVRGLDGEYKELKK